MDRSLWLLLGLRLRGWLRRWGRGALTIKGLLGVALGALALVGLVASFLFAPRILVATQLGLIRQYGPLALLAYCLLNVLVTPGDRSIHYSLAEVNFLFGGPYRPRQLLLYKVMAGAGAALLTALTMTLAFAHHAAMPAAAFAGLFLALELIYLFALVVGLAGSMFGALAYSRGRRLLLVAVGLAAAGALWPVGRAALVLPFREVVARALRSPVVAALTVPFRPFVLTFTAERAWPDLVVNAAGAALVDLALLALVLTLNAGFLEAAAAASERAHERLRRVRRGGAWRGPASARFALPMVPWWGGIGPNLWRQLTAAARSPTRLVGLGALFLLPVLMTAARAGPVRDEGAGPGPALSFLAVIALSAQSSVGHDFRDDRARIEDLKTLPIPPLSMALGQVLTPVVLLTAAAWLSLALIAWLDPPVAPLAAASAALAFPLNLVLVAVENLYFLCYPYQSRGVTSFDFQAIGRQLLLMLAKAAGLVVAGTLAAGVGGLVYWFGGESWPASVGSAAVAALGCGLGLVPAVALAFDRFDVARDAPES